MKTFMSVLSMLVLLALGGFAQASDDQVSSILYNCNVSFHATGRSIYLGVGYTDVSGKGTISCYDFLTGATQHIPIKIKARGPGAGLGVTGLTLSGGATGIGVTSSPEALLGRYLVVRGNAAVGVGAAVGTGLRVSKGAVTLDVSIQAQNGLGVGVDLMFVDISADYEKNDESHLAAAPAPTVTAASMPAPVPAPAPAPVRVATQSVPANVIYVEENQPVQLVDAQGRVLKVIYLRRAR